MQRKRGGKPLIFLNPPIVVGVKICHLICLIERILLNINSWRINMRSKNVHSVFQRFLTDLEEKDHFSHERCINFVPFFQRFARCFIGAKRTISCFLRKALRNFHTFSLCLPFIQTAFVTCTDVLHLFQFCLCIGLPYISSVHCFVPPSDI